MALKKKTIPKGSHKMPDGTIMKNSAHKKMANGGSAQKCWPGYKKQGSKVGKSGKVVNNCVKK